MHAMNGKSIYRDIAGDGMEAWRAIRNACHGIRPQSALAYLGEEQNWDEFYNQCFQGVLLPHFALVYNASCAGNMEKVIAADDQLLDEIPASAAQRLGVCSSAVFTARGEGRGMGLLRKLSAHRPACTFTTAFAVHAPLFSLPLLQAVMAYVYFEWRMGSGITALMPESVEQWQEIFSSDVIASPESIRKALAGHLSGWQASAGGMSL
ncbi:MAG: hypothetical protein GY899_18735 [Verrucomicrobiaceae bacterium]|nr:hypothetical protein [Verrucomicrobiaceae bacterium]